VPGGVMIINGLALPPLLVEFIELGRWNIPISADLKKWENYFQHGGLTLNGRPQIRLIHPAEMIEKTKLPSQEAYPVNLHPEWSQSITRRESQLPLALDPTKSVVIADLFHVPDKPELLVVPLTLDYREFFNEPRVIFYPDDAFEGYWCEIASNFEEFADALEL
jgi:hypothetical protein